MLQSMCAVVAYVADVSALVEHAVPRAHLAWPPPPASEVERSDATEDEKATRVLSGREEGGAGRVSGAYASPALGTTAAVLGAGRG